MFLALREIRHQPTRFTLITTSIVLLAYLTFFLVSLATGLAHSYRAAIDQWNTGSIVLMDSADGSMQASRMDLETVNKLLAVLDEGGRSDVEVLLSSPAVLEGEAPAGRNNAEPNKDGLVKTDAYAWGLGTDSALMPDVIDGRNIEDPDSEVLIDSSLTQEGWAVGDSFKISGFDHEWTIVGSVDDYTYQAAPIVLVDRQALAEHAIADGMTVASALVVPEAIDPENSTDATLAADLADNEAEAIAADDFISKLPGYSVQILTFTLMIASLIVIASFVLGIFIYVLTLQKRPVLGILKARGVPTSYLIRAGAAQTGLLVTTGVAIGLALTVASGLVLPAAVPFRANISLSILITAAFIIVSLIGGLISVRVVARIDPVEAIQ